MAKFSSNPKVKDIDGNDTPKYRKEGQSLFEYDAKSNSYICCYTNVGAKGISNLIAMYEDSY